jgi:hypothetical protein
MRAVAAVAHIESKGWRLGVFESKVRKSHTSCTALHQNVPRQRFANPSRSNKKWYLPAKSNGNDASQSDMEQAENNCNVQALLDLA